MTTPGFNEISSFRPRIASGSGTGNLFWAVYQYARFRRSAARLWLIVGILSLLTSLAHSKEIQAERVFNWDFQRSSDANFDQRPDGWKRRHDRQHPAYIDMRIASRSAETARIALEAQGTLAIWMNAWQTGRWQPSYVAESAPPALANLLDHTLLDNCLEISMDGGAAELVGPTFPMEGRYSYSLRAEMSCTDLDGHLAWIELQLLDESENVIQVLSTRHLQGNVDWQQTSSEIAAPASGKLKWGRIHLKVEPHSSTVLAGTARFDSITIYRMPRLSLSTPLRYHITSPGEPFKVDCLAMGIRENDAHVLFELRDQDGVKLQEHSAPLEVLSNGPPSGQTPPPEPQRRAAKPPHYVSSVGTHDTIDGQTQWTLTLAEPGLYRVSVNLGMGGEHSQQREILIGVMPKSNFKPAGTFGWSISEFGAKLPIDELPELVSRFGAGWVKLPVWFDPKDTTAADNLVALIERLQSLGVQVIGKLDHPPKVLRETFGDGNDDTLYAVNVFRQASDWEPVLEPVLTRVGMKLLWFQIGADYDHSYVGKPDVAETISNMRARMQTYSQELKLALSWNWLDSGPDATNPPWNAIHMTNSPQLSAIELEKYLSGYASDVKLWVSIDPLDAFKYSLLDRVRDLTERMVAIKRSSAEAAFVSDPLRPELQLFTAQKTIGEMLIPWHTLTTSIGSASYVGSIEFPGGSVNHVFDDHDEGIMLLWNDKPTAEQMFLGESLNATDVWGKSIPIATSESTRGTLEQILPANQWPIIVRGIDLNLVRFHQNFELQVASLDNTLSIAQALPVSLVNTLPQSASGTVTIFSPTLLNGDRSETPVQLSHGGKQIKSLPIFIRNDASAGEHRLRFDFDLTSNRPYQFSIYRSTILGAGDIELKWTTTRRSPEILELHVEIRNNTENSVAFDCKLFPIGRPYQRFRIEESKPGTSVQEMHVRLDQIPTGSEAWLRCEQIGSGRVLNYRIEL